MDSATNGAIFFSLGTNAKSSDLSEERIKVFINKFGSLKQKVLWKFETNLPDLPDNVKISKWLPQDDILAHPNVQLFISHCGKAGITEAKYHGVPILGMLRMRRINFFIKQDFKSTFIFLGIPLFGDQFGNADHIFEEGWAMLLPLSNFNQETLSKTLDEALNNRSYGNVVKKLSTLNRDRPEHPLDKAAYWIEYVIRHNGAKHLQSPAVHLNLLQYYMVDIAGFLFVTLYAVIKLLKLLFKTLLRIVCVGGHKKRKME